MSIREILKNGIQKSHYEICMDFLNNSGSFTKFVTKISKEVGYCPDFYEFSTALSNSVTMPHLSKEIGQKAMQANVMFHMYNIKQCNEKIYYITPQLALELSQIELNIDTSYLMSPFPEIHIQIDPGLYTITNIDKKRTFPIVGFYVYMNPKDTDKKTIRILAAAVDAKNTISEQGVEDSLFYFRLELMPGKLKESLKNWLNYIKYEGCSLEVKLAHGDVNVDHIDSFTMFVVNVLLYLTSKDPDVIEKLPVNTRKLLDQKKSSSKKKKLSQKLLNLTKRTIMVVGSKTPFNEKEMSQVKSSGGIGSWSLNHKVSVSSHWRTQWYGSEANGTRYSKIIKINEYEKGPDAADLINKKRIVK